MFQRLTIRTHRLKFLVVAITLGYLISTILVWYGGKPENDLLRQMLTTLGNALMAIFIFYFGKTDPTNGSGAQPTQQTTTVQTTQQQGENNNG
jgi:hypothetical protein